jgi:ubiquinone/menaquinone biosynthesis C-methylase UbiE
VSVVLRWALRRAEEHPDPREVRLHTELLAGLSGVVVEVGCGLGRLFPRYPATVGRLVAVEPDAELRAGAARAVQALPFPAEVLDGDAGRLPLPDGSVDAVVVAEVLCSVPDQRAALAEVRRVLRPGGELRVFEHVVAEPVLGRLAQHLLDATVWPRLLGGCHPTRDTTAALQAAGFGTTGLRRVWSASTPLGWAAGPHVLGTATPWP